MGQLVPLHPGNKRKTGTDERGRAVFQTANSAVGLCTLNAVDP
jgi:hypothetical protein